MLRFNHQMPPVRVVHSHHPAPKAVVVVRRHVPSPLELLAQLLTPAAPVRPLPVVVAPAPVAVIARRAPPVVTQPVHVARRAHPSTSHHGPVSHKRTLVVNGNHASPAYLPGRTAHVGTGHPHASRSHAVRAVAPTTVRGHVNHAVLPNTHPHGPAPKRARHA